jgi:hypothetical protein
MVIRTVSNGIELSGVTGKAGLNYGSAGTVQAGYQRLELLDSSGNILLAATGGRCVSSGCMYILSLLLLTLVLWVLLDADTAYFQVPTASTT